jgi:protein tyrosine phosphatase
MTKHIPLKYECLDIFDSIYNKCEQYEIKNLLRDLKDLIFYQMEQIREQRMEIVAMKHRHAWKNYEN